MTMPDGTLYTYRSSYLMGNDSHMCGDCLLTSDIFVCIYREFLTGFHKRKLEKKDAAKKRAMEKEKQERLDTRREVRSCLIRLFVTPFVFIELG
jgi:hypothetical protein